MQAAICKSTDKLLSEFYLLRNAFRGRHLLWGRGRFAAYSGNVTDEVIEQYIVLQGGVVQDADVTIEE